MGHRRSRGGSRLRIGTEDGDIDQPATIERVRLDGITKHFFEAIANDGVDLVVNASEIHALLGENGAGKTTACSILAGLYRPDSGTITIDGEVQHFTSPADALTAGVGMVYQHFRLVDELTVADNIVLGHPEVPEIVARKWLIQTCEEVEARFGLDLNPNSVVGELSVGQQQRVEIARLLHRGVKVLILDEPTAVLTPQESEALFVNLRELAVKGHSIIVVTHRLNEALALADSVTVMRAGAVVWCGPAADSTPESLSSEMVGREVVSTVSRRTWKVSSLRSLRVEDISVAGAKGGVARVQDVSLTVGEGEILGVCGVAGNGQRELADALAGMLPVLSGSIWIGDQDITRMSVAERVDLGVSYVPEDRLSTGVAAGLSLEDNLLLRLYRDPAMRRGPIFNYARAREVVAQLIADYDIRGVRPGLPVSALSGGNIQRAILAREISRNPKVMIAASPTRGLDVGATMGVRAVLADARDEGLAVLLLSEDLDELLAISDRLVVMYKGRIAGHFATADAEIETLGKLMAGVGINDEDQIAS